MNIIPKLIIARYEVHHKEEIHITKNNTTKYVRTEKIYGMTFYDIKNEVVANFRTIGGAT